MTASWSTIGLAAVALLVTTAAAACPPDAVAVGKLCVDKYEASIWRIAKTETALIAAVEAGTITSAAQLPADARRGELADDYDPGCVDTAAHCRHFYAVSIPGVRPSRNLTWFQAAAACRNAGKRLLSSAEWQVAAFGTEDTGGDNFSTTCNIQGASASNAGWRSGCVSDVGAYDMVGNAAEWVADWDEVSGGTDTWVNNDLASIGGDGTDTHQPSALLRGGSFGDGVYAGVFAVDASNSPSNANSAIGFRCARPLP